VTRFWLTLARHSLGALAAGLGLSVVALDHALHGRPLRASGTAALAVGCGASGWARLGALAAASVAWRAVSVRRTA